MTKTSPQQAVCYESSFGRISWKGVEDNTPCTEAACQGGIEWFADCRPENRKSAKRGECKETSAFRTPCGWGRRSGTPWPLYGGWARAKIEFRVNSMSAPIVRCMGWANVPEHRES